METINSTESNTETRKKNLDSSIAAAVLRQIHLPEFISSKGSISSIKIDEIRMSATKVESALVDDIDVEFSTGEVLLKDVKSIVNIEIFLTWWYDIWIHSDSGEESLGTIPFAFDLDDVRIPSLDEIDLDITEAELQEVSGSIQPINNLDLGSANLEGVSLTSTLLPAAGFGLGGISMGQFNLNGLSIPSITSESFELSKFLPDAPLVLPSITVENLKLPSATAAKVESDGTVYVGPVKPEGLEKRKSKDFGVIGVGVKLVPTMELYIKSLSIDDVVANATINKMNLNNVQTTVSVSGVSLNDIQLDDIGLDLTTKSVG